MLRHLMSFGAVLFLCYSVCSDVPAGENRKKKPQTSADATDWRASIESALGKKLSLDVEEQPLNEVVEYLRDQAGVTVLADTRAMDDVGLPFDAPVSGKLSDMPLHSVLRHLLREFDLTWTVRDGVLLITTPEEAESCMETAVYDVLDLVKLDGHSAPDEYDYDSIIGLITTTVAPNSWNTVGGRGSIDAFRGGVVITQTQDVLDQIGDVLAIFRKAKQIAEECTDKAPPTVCVDSQAGDPAVVKIERAMETSLTFDFVETTLREVAEFIATKCQINVILDHRALEDVGISDDVPSTFRAKDMRVRHALTHILGNLELTWLCRDHALVITTPGYGEDILLTKAYPVADLLEKTLGTDMFGDPRRLAGHDDVVELLTSAVSPETWQDVGGPGSIDSCGHIDVFVVSQTLYVHEQIVGLLGKVRQHLAKCEGFPAALEGARNADKTRLVIYSVPTAASNTLVPPVKRVGTKASVGQNKDAACNRSGLAQVGGGVSSPVIQVVIPEAELLTLITDLIEPDSWKEREDVYAKAVPGSLVIRHTNAAHKQIEQLLRRLNAVRQAPGGGFMGGGGMGAGRMGGSFF